MKEVIVRLAHLHVGTGIAVCVRISFEDHGLVETETLLTCTGQLPVLNTVRDTDCSE